MAPSTPFRSVRAHTLPPAGRVLAFAMLVALGMLGNTFKFTLFFNADFIFGSIFAMVALQFFGTALGTLAAFLIGLPLVLLWGHPYALIIMTAEVLGVGWLRSRHRLGFVQADALFWLLAGVPLVFGTYHWIMKVPLGNTQFVMVKDMVNGLVNVLVARLGYTAFLVLTRRAPVAFREVIYNALALFALAPALIMIAVASRQDFKGTDQQIRVTLGQDVRRMSLSLEGWAATRKATVVHLARMAATLAPRQMQEHLEETTGADPNFLRIGLLDADATITAYYPLVDELGQSVLGRNFADRPFYPILKQTLKPMLSEVVLGRIGVPKPMVVMVAPVVASGAYRGSVNGILGLDLLRERLERDRTTPGARFTLLDRNGMVIMTNRPDQVIMKPFNRGPGRLEPERSGAARWLPAMPPNTPAMEQWSRSFYLAEAKVGDVGEWKLVLEEPTAPFQRALIDRYSRDLALLLLLTLGALALAELVSRRMTATLEELGGLTQDLPGKLMDDAPSLPWPETSILEPGRLVANFRAMSGSLSEQFRQVRQANATLEQRVEERTRDLRESGRMLREAQGIAHLGSYSLDLDTFTFTGSELFDEILGLDPASPRTLETWTRLIHPDWRGPVHAHFAATIMAGEGRFDLDYPILRPGTGEERWVRGRGRRQPGPDGAPDRMVGILQDITEARRGEEERVRLQGQLMQAQKMDSLGSLASGIAHDMNNVLAAILALAEANLLTQPKDTLAHRSFGTITAAAIRGGKMVKSLLTFARQNPAEVREVDLNAILKGNLALLEHTTLAKVHLVTDLAADLRPVRGDANALNHAFMNLCVNAVDAMAEQGTLTLRTRNLDEGQLEVRVEDTGHGMTPEILAKAMDPFFTTKATGKGTGLGLSMAYSTVKAHRGTLELDSVPGQGTRVRMRFPSCGPGPAAGAATGLQGVPCGRPLEVLLVDDDPLILDSTRVLLEALGHGVTTAACGEVALAALQAGARPDLVILDLNMPGLGGVGTLPRLRAGYPGLPVLLATGRADQTALDLLDAYPGVALLAKPFTRDELRGRLEALANPVG